MWILLGPEDTIQPGDQVAEGDLGHAFDWFPVSDADTWNPVGGLVGERIVRRQVTGWQAVKHAIETEVLGTDLGCETTDEFWDCECEKDYIHSHAELDICPRCAALKDDQPDSRKAEVILKIIDE